jgi:hypothetical protein
MLSGYRAHLRAVVGATAAPYGFTLTIWTAAAIVSHAVGTPDGLEAILFLIGAVCAYACVGAAAYGRVGAVLSPGGSREVRLWGALHFPAIGITVGETALIARLMQGSAAFPITSFTVTFTDLTMVAAQFTIADRKERDDDGW